MRDMKLPDDVREFFSKQGKLGAAKRHAGMTAERRSEVAKFAAETRWAKAKPVPKSVPRSTRNGEVLKTTRKTKRSGGTK